MSRTHSQANVSARRLLTAALICGLSLACFALFAADEPPPAEQNVEGYWQGTLKTGAIELRIVFHIVKDEGGKLTATFDSPDQGVNDIATDSASRDGDSIRVVAKPYGLVLEGKIADADTIEAQWKQAGQSLPLSLKRLDKAPDFTRPQEPKRPYPYREEEVVYENAAAGVTLAGTLTLPKSDRPVPAVLLLTGSGAQDRDESLLGHKPFLVLADHLTRQGIAVLRMDDRGIGGSSGKTSDSTTEDLVGDALVGIEYLKARKEIDPKHIGLVGHSEGGLIAPLAAGRSSDVAFIVLLAATGVPGDELVLHQGARIAKAAGTDEQRIADARELQSKLFEIAKNEPDAATAARRMGQVALESKSVASAPTPQAKQAVVLQIASQARLLLTPWFRYFLTYDPVPALRKVQCPVLAINGEKDLQVDPKQNLPPIAKALEAAGNSDVTIKEMPGLNHLFQHCETGAPTEYGRIDETFAPEVLELISTWIGERTK